MSRSRLPLSLYSDRYGIIVCGKAPRGAERAHPIRCNPIFIEPGKVQLSTHTCKCVGVRALFIEPSIVVQVAASRGLTRAPRFKIPEGKHTPLVMAVHELCTVVERDAPPNEQQARLETCLQSMLDLMVASTPGGYGTHPAVAVARDYLLGRLHEAVTLDELARISRLSRYHLARIFTAHIGLPPHAYQTRLRIERAMKLLRDGRPPGEVAGLLGFADQSHLTRHFRRIVGVTPGEYAHGALALI